MAWSDAARLAAQRARERKQLDRTIKGTTLKKGSVTLTYRGQAFSVRRAQYLKQLKLQRFIARKLGNYRVMDIREATARSLFLGRVPR